MGVTTMAISDSTPLSVVPANAVDMKSKTTWIMSGSEVRKNGVIVKENYGPSLERLEVSPAEVLSHSCATSVGVA